MKTSKRILSHSVFAFSTIATLPRTHATAMMTDSHGLNVPKSVNIYVYYSLGLSPT